MHSSSLSAYEDRTIHIQLTVRSSTPETTNNRENVPLYAEVRQWGVYMFEKLNVVMFECPDSFTGSLCGYSDYDTSMAKTLWELYEDQTGFDAVPISSWESGESSITKFFRISGQTIAVGLLEGAIVVTPVSE